MPTHATIAAGEVRALCHECAHLDRPFRSYPCNVCNGWSHYAHPSRPDLERDADENVFGFRFEGDAVAERLRARLLAGSERYEADAVQRIALERLDPPDLRAARVARLAMGVLRYERGAGLEPNEARVGQAIKRLNEYAAGGNREAIVDAINLASLEWQAPSRATHWTPRDRGATVTPAASATLAGRVISWDDIEVRIISPVRIEHSRDNCNAPRCGVHCVRGHETHDAWCAENCYHYRGDDALPCQYSRRPGR